MTSTPDNPRFPAGSDQLTLDPVALSQVADRIGAAMMVPTGAPGEFVCRLRDEAEFGAEVDAGTAPYFVRRLPSGALTFWSEVKATSESAAYVEGEGRAVAYLDWLHEREEVAERIRRAGMMRRINEDLWRAAQGKGTPEMLGFSLAFMMVRV